MRGGDVEPGYWLAILGEAEGLRWVLKNQRMAFTRGSASRALRVRRGDQIILYVTRGAFHNPTRDESQIAGFGEVSEPLRDFAGPIVLAGREFVAGFDLQIDTSLPERAGVPVKPLIDDLTFIRRKKAWGQYFRSGLIQIPSDDFERIALAVNMAIE